jgi:Tol biopolymer transport system component
VLSTIPDSTGKYFDISLSPDARQAVVGLLGGTGGIDLWTVDLDRGTRLRLTSVTGRGFKPLLSSDGRRVLWTDRRQSTLDLFWKRSDGVGPDEAVIKSPLAQDRVATDWSNESIVFARLSRDRPSSIWVAPVADSASAKLYLETKYPLRNARLSPDGRWMAYTSNESSLDQVYVQPFPDPTGGRWLVSAADGGILPQWRADGKELIYLTPGRQIMAVSLKFGPRGVEPSTPQVLFTASGAVDSTRDRTRFLITLPPTTNAQRSPLTVVVNWPNLVSRQ